MIGRDARARVDRIEAKLRPSLPPPFGPLGAMERRELHGLEAAFRARFPSDDVDAWSLEQLNDYLLGWAPSPSAARLAELRHRALPAHEQAELRANRLAIESMTGDQLDEWMVEAARSAAAQEENSP